jgi:hypothetical protein
VAEIEQWVSAANKDHQVQKLEVRR